MQKEDFEFFIDLRRFAWLPSVQEGEMNGSPSKFGGVPWLRPNEPVPLCPHCQREFHLILQLDLCSLPESFRVPSENQHLLQFFSCIGDEPLCAVEGKSWEAFSPVSLVRVITSDEHMVLPDRSVMSEDLYRTHLEKKACVYPTKTILGWKLTDDYPGYVERERLGRWKEEYFDSDPLKGYPLAGEKLGGWPCWIQWVEYPNCPQCKKEMEFLFQIDSNRTLMHQWGDLGCGYITRCPIHKEELAFSWSSP